MAFLTRPSLKKIIRDIKARKDILKHNFVKRNLKEKVTGELFTLESLWRRAATTFSCPCWTATSIAVKPSCKTEKPIEAEFIHLLIFHSKFINKNSIDTILPKNSFKTEIQP